MAMDMITMPEIVWGAWSYGAIAGAACITVVLVGVYRYWQQQAQSKRLVDRDRRPHLFLGYSPLRMALKETLLIISMGCLAIALMRPQWGKLETSVHHVGRDIYIALDVSKSMGAQDMTPNRIECAKRKIHALLEKLGSDRMGLILFSGSACVICPLTTDSSAFYMFLDNVDAESISSGTTALDQALLCAQKSFKSSTKKNKLLLLATDGEDFSVNLEKAYAQAAQSGITIITLGVATEQGAPIPSIDERGNNRGFQKDENGTIVISKLNEQLLEQLAQDSKGLYVRATHDASDISQIHSYIQTIAQEEGSATVITQAQDRAWYFVLGAWALLLLEWMI
jgi:Ca-activated chloride channel family protein